MLDFVGCSWVDTQWQ